MRFLIILCVFFMSVSNANAQKVKVYRWVDDNGVVTFSEYRPKSNKYVELEIEGDRVRTGQFDSEGVDLTAGNRTTNGEPAPEVEELNSQAKMYCEKARHNLKVLDSFKNVRVLDDKGKPKTLTQNDVDQQKRLANRQVELFCK